MLDNVKQCETLWLFAVLAASLRSSHNSQDSQLPSAVILPKVIGAKMGRQHSTAGMSFA